MRHQRSYRLLPLLLLAACGGSETTVVEVDTVSSVTVSPSAALVEVGLSIQFSAEALDDSGDPVTGETITWTSSVPGVASVDANGLATGLTVGATQIRATVGGVTGSQTLTVDPSSCTTFTPVTLNPGEYASFAGNECISLPAGSVGDLYRVALARPTLVSGNVASNTPSVTLNISPTLTTVAATEGSSATDASIPASAARRDPAGGVIDMSRVAEHLRWQDATRAFHDELRLRERALGLPRSALLPRRPAAVAGAPIALVDPPAEDSLFLQIDCLDSTERQPVTLVSFNDQMAVYQETAERDTLAISVEAADELIAYYTTYVRAMVADYWGTIPDTNADGRVTVVTTPNLGENVAAAVYSGDYYQTNAGCPSSNEGETVYFNGPLLGDLAPDSGDPDYYALGTIAHEMKHVVSLYNGLERGDRLGISSSFHDLWIEEGTAEISQSTASRIAWEAIGGPARGTPITRDDILAFVSGGVPAKEIGGIIDVLAGTVRSLSTHPNSVLTNPPEASDQGHSFYATSWHWHRFLGDAFGDASDVMDADFFRALTDPGTPAGGAAGEIQLTGRGSFEQLFEDFVVAVSLHGSGHTAPYAIDTWDLLDAGDIFRNPNPEGSYPWPVTATETTDGSGNVLTSQQWAPFSANTYTSRIGPGGVRFHDFRSSGTAGANISVSGLQQTCDGNGSQRCDRIIVTRLQ